MAEDRAISEAERLWRNRQPAEAVRVLVRRIDELRADVERAQDDKAARASTRDTPVAGVDMPAPVGVVFPPWLRRCAVTAVWVIGGALLLVAIGAAIIRYYDQSKELHLTEDEIVAAVLLSQYCERYAGKTEAECDRWEEAVLRRHAKAAERCGEDFDTMAALPQFGACLRERGVAMP